MKTDLLRPEAYVTLKPARVELVETHISWVFLLEHDVFKVKRPVNLGFLDFRTVEQRRSACEAEAHLNERLAPHVYRGVVPVLRGEDGYCNIGGTGVTVDWAVHMVRLPDDERADLLLANDALSNPDIDRIAQRVAAFHATARADDETARFGATDVVLRNIEENFSQTKDTIRTYLRPEDADEIVRWQRDFVRDHEGIFAERVRAGRVKDGHGDIRLEHVYLDRSSPTIIDCIEFNDRFRFADVCADIAFLSMDLARHGRVDLAERLLAVYAREANDFDLYALVDFYESYRAFVRGKVSAMTAGDAQVSEDTRKRAAADARRHFLLALSADRRSLLKPVLVAVGGVIASGKSTVAERLGAEMGAPVVSADRTRKAMLGVAARHPLREGAWQGSYDPGFTEHVYEDVLRQAGVVLSSGRPVVVDASFRSASMRRAARDVGMAHDLPFRFVECRADPSLCRARLVERERTGGVSDGRLEIFDAFCARFEPVTELDPTEHLVLDTSRSIDESVRHLQTHLDMWPLGFVG